MSVEKFCKKVLFLGGNLCKHRKVKKKNWTFWSILKAHYSIMSEIGMVIFISSKVAKMFHRQRASPE